MSDAPWRVLAFAPDNFGPDLFALCRAVPALDHLLCRLDDTHDPVYPQDRVLRSYQRDLARHGAFEIALPGTATVLRSGHAVVLEDKAAFFGVVGRPDIVLAAARVGFTQPLCAVVLPLHRTVVQIKGPAWNIDAPTAQRALSLFAAAGLRGDEAPPLLAPLVVTGDANYAHHVWNQLGAVARLLEYGDSLTVLATHQPIAPLAEIFSDFPGLTVTATPASALPRLDPRAVLPVVAGGRIVARAVRQRIQQVAARRAGQPVQNFLRHTQPCKRLWLTLRAQGRTALNLFDALLAIAEPLLRRGDFAIVLDGYSRPNDYATNSGYDRATAERAVMQEAMVARMLTDELARRLGEAVRARIFDGIGADMLDSIHLATNCHAYFAHHGTLQHKIGYFTTVPGMAHANPAITLTDPAAGHRHVIEAPGVVEYVARALIDDVPAAGGGRMQPNNAYRFNNLAAVVSSFMQFLARQGLV